jgi:phytoene dehydrogenase-like protein
VVVERSIEATASALGMRDGRAYARLVTPLVGQCDALMDALLGPFSVRHPIVMARFGRHAIRSAQGLARDVFEGERARAMFAGVAAHSMVPSTSSRRRDTRSDSSSRTRGRLAGISRRRTAATNALVAYLRSLGGEVVTDTDRNPGGAAAVAGRAPDVTPRQLVRIAGDRLSRFYRWRLARYRYGPGVFKMDWALNAPVPWRAPGCHRAGTLHLGGSLPEIAASERASWERRDCERPYVLVTQPSLFDPTRAPRGKHTLWAYCHVPHGSAVDMRMRIERQIERYAPGFRDCIEEAHAILSQRDREHTQSRRRRHRGRCV